MPRPLCPVTAKKYLCAPFHCTCVNFFHLVTRCCASRFACVPVWFVHSHVSLSRPQNRGAGTVMSDPGSVERDGITVLSWQVSIRHNANVIFFVFRFRCRRCFGACILSFCVQRIFESQSCSHGKKKFHLFWDLFFLPSTPSFPFFSLSFNLFSIPSITGPNPGRVLRTI